MAKAKNHLVIEFLENVSRTALEKYQEIIRRYIEGKNGIYALYRGNRLKYVGLATDLRRRLKMHLRDRHSQSWDKFSVFLTIDDKHLREMESLVIRIAKPTENWTTTKFKKAENLLNRFRKDIILYQRQELNEIVGIEDEKPVRKPRKRISRGKTSALAPYVEPKKPFFKIYAKYKGKDYDAIVLGRNGTIKYGNKIFSSPSLAAKEITKGSTDGWRFWKYKDPKTGEKVLLDNLRKG